MVTLWASLYAGTCVVADICDLTFDGPEGHQLPGLPPQTPVLLALSDSHSFTTGVWQDSSLDALDAMLGFNVLLDQFPNIHVRRTESIGLFYLEDGSIGVWTRNDYLRSESGNQFVAGEDPSDATWLRDNIATNYSIGANNLYLSTVLVRSVPVQGTVYFMILAVLAMLMQRRSRS